MAAKKLLTKGPPTKKPVTKKPEKTAVVGKKAAKTTPAEASPLPELSTCGQLSRASMAELAKLTTNIVEATDEQARQVAMGNLTRMQVAILRTENQNVEGARSAMVSAAKSYVRAYYRRCLILVYWRASLHRVAGESVVGTWESEMAMELGMKSPSTIRRWMREGRDPIEWWEYIDAQAGLLGGKPPPVSQELTRRRKDAKLLKEKEEEDENTEPTIDGRGLDALLGLPEKKGKTETPVQEHTHGVATGPGVDELLEDLEDQEAQTVLTLLHADTWGDAVWMLDTLIAEHAKLMNKE